jgi:hypothetical protein
MKTLARPRDRDEVLRRLKDVRPDSARRWGRMSAHQMVCHLGDGFRMGMGKKVVTARTGPLPQGLVRFIALYLPLRWPAGIATSPEIDQILMGCTKPTDFAVDVAQLQALVEQATTLGPDFEWPMHPVFGRLSGADWLRWGYLHMDHHLRQFGA